MKSHLQSYPCPLIINYFWNLGFLLGITILLQIISGIFLGLHYTSDINSAYFSIFFIIREIYYGWCLRYLHSNGSSFVFLLIFLHLGRAISYGSYFYNPNTWFSGIIIIFFLMGTAFMGYVLPLGQMSLWGVTVITNLLSAFPSLIEWLCGGHYIYNPTFKRFFVFHFLFPFLLCGFLLYHIFNLHFLSSNNPLRNSTNNKIAFFPFIISKDLYGKILILYLYLLQIHFGFSSFSHPDNALEACGLLTPLHIVPEWYFLCQYAMLKAVPNKNAGFIILFTSIFILFYFMRSLSISFYFIIFFTNRFNGFYLCFWFLLLFSFIWIGGQFPVDNFLSYGRILTLHYYYLLICILFSRSFPVTSVRYALRSLRSLSFFACHVIPALRPRGRNRDGTARSLTSFHSLHYVHAPFHSVPNEVRDERPSRVMRTGKEREWTRLTAQHLQSYRSDWWPFPAVSMSSTHLLHLSHVGSYPPFLIPFVSLRYASLLSLHSFRREPTSLWGGDTTEVSVRWEVAERYTSLYARLTYGPSVLCSSRVALRVPLRSRLRRVVRGMRWASEESEPKTDDTGRLRFFPLVHRPLLPVVSPFGSASRSFLPHAARAMMRREERSEPKC